MNWARLLISASLSVGARWRANRTAKRFHHRAQRGTETKLAQLCTLCGSIFSGGVGAASSSSASPHVCCGSSRPTAIAWRGFSRSNRPTKAPAQRKRPHPTLGCGLFLPTRQPAPRFFSQLVASSCWLNSPTLLGKRRDLVFMPSRIFTSQFGSCSNASPRSGRTRRCQPGQFISAARLAVPPFFGLLEIPIQAAAYRNGGLAGDFLVRPASWSGPEFRQPETTGGAWKISTPAPRTASGSVPALPGSAGQLAS